MPIAAIALNITFFFSYSFDFWILFVQLSFHPLYIMADNEKMLGMLEEDDEFEEFQVEGIQMVLTQDWNENEMEKLDESQWEDNWDDDDLDDDFSVQLR